MTWWVGGVARVRMMRRPGGEEEAVREPIVGVDVKVLAHDTIRHREGMIVERGGLTGAVGDPERCGGRVRVGVGQRLEAGAARW
jgi:hypothetical protein